MYTHFPKEDRLASRPLARGTTYAIAVIIFLCPAGRAIAQQGMFVQLAAPVTQQVKTQDWTYYGEGQKGASSPGGLATGVVPETPFFHGNENQQRESADVFQPPPLQSSQSPTQRKVFGQAGGKIEEAEEHKITGFLDFNIYPYTDVDSDNSATVNALADLPHGFQYFSLTNFGRDPSRSELEEFDAILTEQNLRWQLPGDIPITIAAQALIRSGGADNDVIRFGPRWAIHDTWYFDRVLKPCGLKYWVAFYGAQFDHSAGYQWQMEHCFWWSVFPELFDKRVYVAGFADHNINHADGTDSIWLEEAQLGVRLIGEWHLVAEQRYNGFRQGNESSVGVGFEYVIRFK